MNSLSFSADGAILVSGSSDNNAIVWDVNSDTPTDPMVLSGHREPITGVAITSDASLIATISEDNTLRLWGLGPQNFG